MTNNIEYSEEFNGIPIKSFEQILDEILYDWQQAALKKGMELDIMPFSDAHIRASAIAQQIYTLYLNGAMCIDQYMPDTATGKYLEAHAKSQSLERKPATVSTGKLLQFKRDPNLTAVDSEINIPAGEVKVISKKEIVFQNSAAIYMAPNVLEVSVPYEAVVPGEDGNIYAGEIISFYEQPPSGISYVTNLDATKDGSDREDDDSLRERYFEATRMEDWHGSPAWLEHQAMKIPGITSAKALKHARGEGTTDLLITSGWTIPSPEKIKAVYDKLTDPSIEPINIDLQVIAPEEVFVPLTVHVPDLPPEKVEGTFKKYLRSLTGKRAIYPLHIAAALIAEGAENPIIQQPAEPIYLTEQQLPFPGVITLV